MYRTSFFIGSLLSLALPLANSSSAQENTSGDAIDIDSEHWNMLDQYCADCHNFEDFSGGLAFDLLSPATISDDAEVWEEVILKLRGSMMPPPGQERPAMEKTEAFVAWLENTIDQAAQTQAVEPGQVLLHRLNRSEYEYAVKDLLAIEFDSTFLLPKDDISDGFDNVSNVLQVSPSFIDQYLNAARLLSNQALGNSDLRERTENFSGPAGIDQSNHVDGLPLGTSGGFITEHVFPAAGQYSVNLNAFAFNEPIAHTAILMVDGEQVYEMTVGGPPKPGDAPTGPFGRGGAPQGVRLTLSAGKHEISAAFVASAFKESEDLLYSQGGAGGFGGARITGVQIVGPYDAEALGSTPSRDLIFTCYPTITSEERACAEQIIENLASKAYRRPVTTEDTQGPLDFYLSARERESFESGIQNALMAILASPSFLYRLEEAPAALEANGVYSLDGLAMASRLSFFMWSSLPDQELIDLAITGELSKTEVLEQQVDRMLADPRAESLVSNFAFQWLDVIKLEESDPDPTLYPSFNAALSVAFNEEMRLFIGSVFNEDKPVTDLMNANYTYVNEALAQHYNINDVRGNRYRKVILEDENRWGLLGKGSILLTTSYPNRTSPVLRGAWVLEKITGTPPTAPPPNVEALKETGANGEALTIRDLLAQHRANPSCNGCHGVMDPLGLALENYNAIGAWQTFDRYARADIDASGTLPDGRPIKNPADLRKALMSKPDQFVLTITKNLMTFALGRIVEYRDMPRVREIVRDSAKNDYRFSSILKGIVTSKQFRMNQMSEHSNEVSSEQVATVH